MPSCETIRRRGSAVWALLLLGAGPVALVAQDGLKLSLLSIKVNGAMVSEFEPVLQDSQKGYCVTSDLLAKAHIGIPSMRPIQGANREYYPLSAIQGVTVHMNGAEQMLEIQVPPEAFTDAIFQVSGIHVGKPDASEPGFFINHDFQYLRNSQTSGVSGLMEGGFFSRLGVLTTRFASSDLLHRGGIRRLDTQFFRDFPGRRATLAIGDSISSGNPWARQVYFAGVRWASKFTTQRGFVPYALPSLSGTAVSPSVVDVYVNNVKMFSRSVEMGPFTVNNIPVLSTQGQIQMVVTDVLGRQQIIAQQYIATVQVLRKGVSEYTYEAGTLRQNYGFTSYGYKSFFVEGTHRYGITDNFTIDGRAELGLDNRTASAGFAYAWSPVGIFGGGVAASAVSNDARGAGYLAYASFSHPGRGFSYAAQYQLASRDFNQLGLREGQRAPSRLLQASVNRSLGSRNSIALGYLQRDGRTDTSARSIFASLSVRVGRGFLILGGNYSTLPGNLQTGQNYGATVSFLLPLGPRTIASATTNIQPSGASVYSEVQQSLPVGPGYGYRVRTNNIDQNRVDAGFSYQDNIGTYLAETSQGNGGNSYRFGRTGSLVFLHGHLLPARWLRNSFAVVEVPGQKDVDVFVNNQVQAHTNGSGVALVPTMVPYDTNTIRIDDAGVPLDSALDIAERSVVPFARSGLYLKFAAQQLHGATVELRTEDGQPVPVGAAITVNARPEEYQVAFRGEAFISDIHYPALLTARWDGHACTAKVDKAPMEPLPHIAPLVCQRLEQ
jgi:outer membrane usher protein